MRLLLATRKSARRLPFQVCFVGQPELRKIIDAADLAPLRALVSVSCHLGPIERAETGAYIEHRLRKVGWTGSPHFEPGPPRSVRVVLNAESMTVRTYPLEQGHITIAEFHY